jgi:NifU-like protein involved in Fe-S cluster formation
MSMRANAPEYSGEVRQRFERAAYRLPRPADGLERFAGGAGKVDRGVRVEFEAWARGGHIVKCAFRVYGCPHVIAAASWVAEHAEGRAVGDTAWLDPKRIATVLEAPPQKLGNLLVVEDAFHACVAARPPMSGQNEVEPDVRPEQ